MISTGDRITRNENEQCDVVHTICKAHGAFVARPISNFNGVIIYSECPKCADERKIRQEKERLREQEKERLRAESEFLRNLKCAGCGNEYISKRGSLSNETQLLNAKLNNGKTLLSYLSVDQEKRDFKMQDNLFIFGSCGVGKTFFACRMIDEALKLGKTYKIATGFELISIYANSNQSGVMKINNADNIAHFLEGVDGLIIDEIDYFLRESRTQKEKEVLEVVTHIVDKEGIRLIALGNNKWEEMVGFDHKILSRITNGENLSAWGIDDLRLKR